jgi:hypothetical protein
MQTELRVFKNNPMATGGHSVGATLEHDCPLCGRKNAASAYNLESDYNLVTCNSKTAYEYTDEKKGCGGVYVLWAEFSINYDIHKIAPRE